MVATNLKAETISLMDYRASLEAEMDAIIEYLCGPGGPGLSGNLVDSEGFPRAGIDIPAIRSKRSRLADVIDVMVMKMPHLGIWHHLDRIDAKVAWNELYSRVPVLKNDHKNITGQIEKNLQVLHSFKLNKADPSPMVTTDVSASVSENTSQASPMAEDSIVRIPFAIIDEISDDSPAAEDGLQLGDEIVKFGDVERGVDLQSRLVVEAQSNQGNPVPLVIVRQRSVVNITVTPRPWRGRGLLGCHFRFL